MQVACGRSGSPRVGLFRLLRDLLGALGLLGVKRLPACMAGFQRLRESSGNVHVNALAVLNGRVGCIDREQALPVLAQHHGAQIAQRRALGRQRRGQASTAARRLPGFSLLFDTRVRARRQPACNVSIVRLNVGLGRIARDNVSRSGR